jgi:hypothetical protein
MSSFELKSVRHLEEGFGVLRRYHRFEKLSVAVFTSKGTMIPRDADGCKPILLRREGIIMIRGSPGNGDGELVSEMGLPNPERLGLELVERSVKEIGNHHSYLSPQRRRVREEGIFFDLAGDTAKSKAMPLNPCRLWRDGLRKKILCDLCVLVVSMY